MKAELNPLASRVSTALTTAHPEFAASREILAEGDVEFHVEAPRNSNAGALVVSTARGEDICIRFAPPQMFYGVDDEHELLTVVDALMEERALFLHIVSANGEWVGTTLVSQGQEVSLEAWSKRDGSIVVRALRSEVESGTANTQLDRVPRFTAAVG